MLTWYGATSEVPWLFLLSAWVLALVAATALYAAWNRTGLSLHIAARAGVPGEGSPLEELPPQVLSQALFERDGAELEVGLDVRRTARGPAWIEGRIAGRPFTLGTGLIPRSGWRRTVELADLRRGPLGATGWSIGTSDPLGFFAGRREFPDSEVALVFPRFTSLAGRRPVRELEAAAAAPRAGAGNEMFGIREYRAGDALRRIHWRSSARRGELVVREYEPPGVQTVAIVLDPAPSSRDVADQIARIAASEAWDCLREGGRVVISAPGLEPTESPRDLWGLLEWLARYPDLMSGVGEDQPNTIIVTADPAMLEAPALRRWLVGDAPAGGADVDFERVGTRWPL